MAGPKTSSHLHLNDYLYPYSVDTKGGFRKFSNSTCDLHQETSPCTLYAVQYLCMNTLLHENYITVVL